MFLVVCAFLIHYWIGSTYLFTYRCTFYLFPLLRTYTATSNIYVSVAYLGSSLFIHANISVPVYLFIYSLCVYTDICVFVVLCICTFTSLFVYLVVYMYMSNIYALVYLFASMDIHLFNWAAAYLSVGYVFISYYSFLLLCIYFLLFIYMVTCVG